MNLIARLFKRSKTTIYRILQEDVGKKYLRAGKLTEREIREIKAEIRRANTNIPIIKRQMRLQVCRNTIRNAIKKEYKYARVIKKIELTANHRTARMNFARQSHDWANVIFSDEKKFNLAGPDGCYKTWMKKGTERTVDVPNRSNGSVMVWGAISRSGKSVLQPVTERLNADRYCQVLRDGLLPMVTTGSIFQQDGASCHTAHYTRQFLAENNIPCLTWPSRSPDLNPIENIWAYMTHKIYANAQVYNNAVELERAIMRTWDEIPIRILNKLNDGMNRRMQDVIAKRAHDFQINKHGMVAVLFGSFTLNCN